MGPGFSRGPRNAVAALAAAIVSAGCAHAPARGLDACSIAAASQTDALMRVPFEIVQGRVYVQARVNGAGRYRFAVDTGASGMGRADATLVRDLNLSVTGTNQSSDGVSTATVNTVHLNSIDLGGLVRENLDIITRDYSSSVAPEAAISGIIGRDFFADGLLVIDFPSRTLSFSRTRGLAQASEGALTYERPFRVPVSIGDVSAVANLDTGAAVALVLPRQVFEQVAAGPLEEAGRAHLTNNTIETGRAIVHGPVRVGAINVSEVETRVSDRYPEVLIGGQILQNYMVAIDQRTRLVATCARRM